MFTHELSATGQKTAGKRLVLRRCLDVLRDGADATVVGRLFHVQAAATVKALSPTAETRVSVGSEF